MSLEKSEQVKADDQVLQAQPNDLIVLTYIDAKNATGEARTVVFKARVVEGSLGSVRVSQTQISDQELRVKTQLKTASALTNIGNRYKEFGLKQHADAKYEQALTLCEEISAEAAQTRRAARWKRPTSSSGRSTSRWTSSTSRPR